MNRRGFLTLLAPAAALIVAPELLIPRKSFFLPPVGGWHGNMTATEVLNRMHKAWNELPANFQRQQFEYAMRLVNPPMLVLNPTAYRLANELQMLTWPGRVHYVQDKLVPLTFKEFS